MRPSSIPAAKTHRSKPQPAGQVKVIRFESVNDPATWPHAPETPGTSDCSQCGAGVDYLLMIHTPSDLCPVCVGRADPIPPWTPRSNPFWLLTPQEIERAETEIIRLAAEAKRLDESSEALARKFGDGSDEYESEAQKFYAIQRERLLLHMLHAASRQYAWGAA